MSRWIKTALIMVFLGGTLLRLPALTNPITGVREAQTASISRNIAKDGPRGILYPRVDYIESKPGYLLLEFPLYNAISAIFIIALPHSGDLPQKLPSFMAFLTLCLFLHDLVRRSFSKNEALISLALLAFMPISTLMSVSAQPDMTSLALFVMALALFDRHLESNSRWLFYATLAAAILSVLAKPPNAYLILPLIALLIARKQQKNILSSRYLLGAALAITAAVAWMAHGAHVNQGSEICANFTVDDANTIYAKQHGRMSLYTNPSWYMNLWVMLRSNFHSYTLALSLISFLYFKQYTKKQRLLVYGWLLGLVALCLIVPYTAGTHSYYHLGLSPVLAIASSRLITTIRQVTQKTSTCLSIAAIPLLLLVPVFSGTRATISHFGRHKSQIYLFGEAAARFVPDNGRLLIIAERWRMWDGSHLYRAKREGWRFAASLTEHRKADIGGDGRWSGGKTNKRRKKKLTDGRRDGLLLSINETTTPEERELIYARRSALQLSIPELHAYRARGATHLAYLGPADSWRESQPELANYVIKQFKKTHETKDWTLFDLRL